MKTVTAQQMRDLDARTINEAGIPGRILMKTAGEGAAEEILHFIHSQYHPRHLKRFLVLAGKGNNGGDAYVVARYLHNHSEIPVTLFAVCPLSELQGDARFYAELTSEVLPITLIDSNNENAPSFLNLKEGNIIIDGLLGTGINGPLRAPYDAIITEINSSPSPVIALDTPSGLNCDDGSIATDAVKADLTVTMGLPKRGFLLGEGPERCGILKCIDIGIPQDFINTIPSDFNMIFSCDVNTLKRRKMNSYKNRHGHVLIIGGSYKYPGAPILSAMAALRAGAGLVTLAVPESANIAMPNMHSIIFQRIEDSSTGTFSADSLPELKQLTKLADTVVIGPGITTEPPVADMLKEMLQLDKTTVLDADALNLIAQDISILKNTNTEHILTPHHGEFRRLMKALEPNATHTETSITERVEGALTLAKAVNAIIVLKGHHTVIADRSGNITVNSSGSPALATAGSGDVLSGIIGAFINEDLNIFDTVASAVYIHGECGELSQLGIRGTSADDLINIIPEAMMNTSIFA